MRGGGGGGGRHVSGSRQFLLERKGAIIRVERPKTK